MQTQLPYASTWNLLLIFIKLRRRLRVTGDSMVPTLREGDVVLIDERAYRHRLPAIGDVVVVNHPHQPGTRMIKRVEALTEEGHCFVVGDNRSPHKSTDSRAYGTFPPEAIIGKVTSKLMLNQG